MTTETKNLIAAFLNENCADFMYAAYILDNQRRVEYKKAIYMTYFQNKGCDWTSMTVREKMDNFTPRQAAIFLTRFELVYDFFIQMKRENMDKSEEMDECIVG